MLPDPLSWLRASGAQTDVIEGLSGCASDWPTLWSQCPRGDWLLGIATRLGVDQALLVRAAVACAAIANEAGTAEAMAVLDVARRFADGDARHEEVAEATRALEAAMSAAPDPGVEAAMRAALAVGLGVADRETLASAPAAATEATILSMIDCGLPLAMRWAHDKCATAVRDAVPWTAVEPCVAALATPGSAP